MKFGFFAAAISFLFAVSGLAGQRTVTLEDCLELSLSRSAAARVAGINESIAGARVTQARSIAMPNVSAKLDYTRLDELQEIELGDERVTLGTLDNYSATASIRQLLFAGGKVGAALRAADLTRSHAALARSEAELAIEFETVQLFNNILLSQESVKVFESSVEMLGELVNQEELKLKQDVAVELDVLTAQVRFENEKTQLIRARNSLSVLLEMMRNLTGIEEDIVLEGELAFVRPDAAEIDPQALALKERPLIRTYEVAASLRKEDESSTRSDLMPSLSAFFNYNGANSYGFVGFGESEWEWHWSGGLSLSWNIWDGDLTRGLIREKSLEYAKAVVELEDLERTVALEVRSTLLDLKHAAEAVDAASVNVSRAQKAMGIVKSRHEEGLATSLDYADANLSLKTAKFLHLTALRDHMNARARLKRSVGVDLKDYLIKQSGVSDEK